jgi:hypothetical protein
MKGLTLRRDPEGRETKRTGSSCDSSECPRKFRKVNKEGRGRGLADSYGSGGGKFNTE